jgi:hypothetical protein
LVPETRLCLGHRAVATPREKGKGKGGKKADLGSDSFEVETKACPMKVQRHF